MHVYVYIHLLGVPLYHMYVYAMYVCFLYNFILVFSFFFLDFNKVAIFYMRF